MSASLEAIFSCSSVSGDGSLRGAVVNVLVPQAGITNARSKIERKNFPTHHLFLVLLNKYYYTILKKKKAVLVSLFFLSLDKERVEGEV